MAMRSLARLPTGPLSGAGESWRSQKWRRSWVKAHHKWQMEENHAPLMVTAHLGSPYVPAVDGVVHLDAILSAGACAVINAGPGADFEDSVIPIPSKLLWVSEGGRPLWAASDLRPASEVADVRVYWHRRYPDDRAHLAQQMAANTSAGRWKDYRVPMTARATERLTGLCIGHEEHVGLLLSHISHVGKKPAQGKGRVLRWEVTRLDMPLAEAEAAILAARPVPMDYFREMGAALPAGGRTVPRQGWTSPYWDARHHAEVVHG